MYYIFRIKNFPRRERILKCIPKRMSFIAEKLVVPNQKKYPWYHQQYRRVPTIDECYTDDIVCYTEADCQFKRDK